MDDVRWFDALGRCQCGRPATGVLRGSRNESFGPSCERCANARLKRADKARALLSPASGTKCSDTSGK